MIISSILLLLLVNFFSFATPEIQITACPGASETWIGIDEPIPADLRIPTEEEIAVQGHFSGFKPLAYEMWLFRNYTDYIAYMHIEARITESTKYVMLNLHPESRSCHFEYANIKLNSDDVNLRNICISNYTYVEKSEVFVMQLTQELPWDTVCTIADVGCIVNQYDENLNVGAKGMRFSKFGESEILYSDFYMRNARTVFPCMDHPSLKAAFEFCIAYNSTFTIASSMGETFEKRNDRPSSPRSLNCFSKTRPIAPSSLSFALMKSYEKIVQIDSNLVLFAPVGKREYFQWILETARRAVSHMIDYTGLELAVNSTNLQFVIVYPEMHLGASSFGQIILNGTEMEQEPDTTGNMLTLYRAIVQQWLGHVVSVRHWNEICFQDGLISYLESSFVGENMSTDSIIEDAQQSIIDGAQPTIPSLLEESSNDNGTIRDKCRLLGLLIFHNLKQGYGSDFAEKFLTQLFSDYAFANAGIDEWDVALVEGHRGFISPPVSYLKNWFSNPSPLKFFTSRSNGEDEDHDDAVLNMEAKDSNLMYPRSLFVRVYNSATLFPEPTYTAQNRQVLYELDSTLRWYLVDPDGITLSYKIYDVETYRNVLENPVNSCGPLTAKRLQRFVKDFCTSLLNDFITHKDPNDKEAWLRVFELAKKYVQNNTICTCCITAPSERDASCRSIDQQCDRLSLIKFVLGEKKCKPRLLGRR